MRQKLACVALTFSLLAVSCESVADYFWDGSQLKSALAADDRISRGVPLQSDAHDSTFGMGYIEGAVDAFNGQLICVPQGVTLGQLMAMINKYLVEHPDEWHFEADVLVLKAIGPTFPCKKKSSAPADVIQ